MHLDSRAFVEQQLQGLRSALGSSMLDAAMRQRAEILDREVSGHLTRRGLPSRSERTPVQLWGAVSQLVAARPELAEDAAVTCLRRLGEFYHEQPEGFAWDWSVQVHDDGVQDGEIDDGVVVEEWVSCWRTVRCSITQLSVHCELDLPDEENRAVVTFGYGLLVDALFGDHHTFMLDLAMLSAIDDDEALACITQRQVLRSHRDHSLGLIAVDMSRPAAFELLSFFAAIDEGAMVCKLSPSVSWETWAAWLDELLQSLQVRGRLKIRELCDSRCWQRLLGGHDSDMVLLDDLWDYVHWIGIMNGDQLDGSLLLYSKERGRLLDFLEQEPVT